MKFIWIVVALLVTWGLFFICEKYRRHKAIRNLEKSNGTFDEYAENALETIENIQNPTPKDHFLAARIIDLNAHDGRINNVRVLNNVVDRYMYNLQPYVDKGNPTTDRLDWFELDQIENFMDRHMDIMTANPEHNNFIEAVLQARPKKVVQTIENAKESANNKKEAFETYVKSNINYTSDTQNVHDSAVNEQLRSTWKKLQQTTPPNINKNAVFTEVQQYIHANAEDDEKKKRALRALEELKNAKYNATVGTTENDLLTTVWSRAEVPINYKNKKLIKDAVVDSLVDMSLDGAGVVCSNGRCARLMESLVHTDADEAAISGAMTVEQIRNDAFKRSNEILQETIKEVRKDPMDGKLQKVARSYDDPSVQTDEESELRFKELVKGKIDNFISTSFKSKMTPRDYNNVRDHCLAAIESI